MNFWRNVQTVNIHQTFVASQKAYKFVQFSDPAKTDIFAHVSSSIFL